MGYTEDESLKEYIKAAEKGSSKEVEASSFSVKRREGVSTELEPR